MLDCVAKKIDCLVTCIWKLVFKKCNRSDTADFSKKTDLANVKSDVDYLVFISANKYFKFISDTKFICGNLKECQKKSIENITTSDSNFAPTLINFYPLRDVTFIGQCTV